MSNFKDAWELAQKIDTMEDWPGDVAIVECVITLRAEVERLQGALAKYEADDVRYLREVARLKAAAHGALAAWHAGLCGEVGLADALRRIYEGEVRDADPTE